MAAFYNEIDEYAARWLRNLIAAGHIADGVVDTRSILDIEPYDLVDFDQCHFFAGIGVWSYALRLAGWPDDRQVWTGSCPCQPFSVAGAGRGLDDERHLWPHWHHLIRELHPGVVFGEQVASKDGLAWLDLVQDDLEGEGYAVGPVDLCAAGVGAPHIRQRLWFVADRLAHHHHQDGCGGQPAARLHERSARPGCSEPAPRGADGPRRHDAPGRGAAGRLGDDDDEGLQARERADLCGARGRGEGRAAVQPGCAPRGLADDQCAGVRALGPGGAGAAAAVQGDGAERERVRPDALAGDDDLRARPGPTNGHWRVADWLFCRDSRWRPVEPGTFPLADGAPARVGRLRAYGNAIVASAAAEVIAAYMECRP